MPAAAVNDLQPWFVESPEEGITRQTPLTMNLLNIFLTATSSCIVLGIAAQVNITLYVRASNCSGSSHENVSSPEYRDLERNLKGNVSKLQREEFFFFQKDQV